MRLIDADKLQDYFWDNRSKLFQSKDCRIAIDKAPTEKAIPIDWIIKWECGFLKPNGEHRRVIKEMLHDWEKENATEFTD